ncbi:TPA: RNA 2',3'-cyclic phosphodiesterase [Candidatus Woesearchaeota archaeon]|nr:RNA 2',3'-cyclic phosphodiesterase [Candidatus Woesearchaeota archaeon]HIH47650.1 RNA 2',3'-cyclic phosphodiesterase [Candidatus Woesearchaeota archaeon]HII88479.1 RNA 2',3'-cyclic phosphodiesterase [Candidatus Woesearchaeota archaeon]
MTEKIQKIRCFIAIDLPQESIEEIQRIQTLIKKQNLVGGKYTAPEHLHLTLKFLGEISPEQVQAVQEKLKTLAFKRFDVHLGDVGIFSEDSGDHIRIIWIQLAGQGVGELQQAIDGSLKGLFPKEERFMSHITLVRVKKAKDKKALMVFLKTIKAIPGPHNCLSVPGFVLKQSTLTLQGPLYKDLAFYPCSS